MKASKVFKRALAHLLVLTGIPDMVRRRTRDRVGILLYHDPSPEVFDLHLGYLRRHYELIPFSRLVDALTRRDFSTIPPHSLVIHIDDGYATNHRLQEVMELHDVHATIYLCSHIADTSRHFWSKLKGGRSKWLSRVENTRLLDKLSREAGFTPDREYPERRALSREEILGMSARADFQSHGRFHFSLLTLDDGTLAADLRESRDRVEELTGLPCLHFSFPFGDYGSRELEAVQRAGYASARTTEPGWISVDTDPFRLPIVADVAEDASVARLRAHLSGGMRLGKRIAFRGLTHHLHEARARALMKRRFF